MIPDLFEDERRDAPRLLRRLDAAWEDFEASYAGLSDAQLMEPGVTGDWSVRDILAHVTTWEEEALTHLPLILEGGTPPRYSVAYGGIDAFNARMTERKASLPLATVRRQQEEIHRRLVDFVRRTPGDRWSRDSRLRRRLRLDAYGHYPLHAEAIRQWRRKSPV
jgi:Mycothiol maleylpyruvate isomerase N-terminal domain